MRLKKSKEQKNKFICVALNNDDESYIVYQNGKGEKRIIDYYPNDIIEVNEGEYFTFE